MRRARLKVHASGIDEQIDRLRYARERSRIRAAYFARLSDHPERTIRRWCATGYLPATRRGPRVWWVDLHPLECTAEVRALLEQVQQRRDEDEAIGVRAMLDALSKTAPAGKLADVAANDVASDLRKIAYVSVATS